MNNKDNKESIINSVDIIERTLHIMRANMNIKQKNSTSDVYEEALEHLNNIISCVKQD